MSFFHSAGDTNLGGGIFNLVNGTQNNYYSHSRSECSLVRIQPGEEWKEILYREYERIELGRINLLRTLYHEDTWRGYIGFFEQDSRPEAERVVSIVSVADPNGRDESNPLLAVKYIGENSYESFKEDIIRFSQQRMTAMAQLRAFNDSRLIPVIIFNEELVSVHHFLKHNRYSVQARCYLHFHSKARALFPGASFNERPSWASLVDPYNLLSRLWFRPQTGALCFGPPGPTPFDDRSPHMFLSEPDMGFSEGRSLCLELPPLPLNASHDDTILLNYIICNVPERLVAQQVSVIYRHDKSGLIDRGIRLWREQLRTNKWTTWRGTVLKYLLEIPLHEWTHEPDVVYKCDLCLARWKPISPLTMERRGTRFKFTRRTSSITFKFTERLTGDRVPFHEEGWLTQAGWVLSCLGISRRDWASCSIVTGIELLLTSEDRRFIFDIKDAYNDFDPPCYLFVPPPPQSSGGAPDIETWLRGENLYYYSYDPEGGSAITKQERISLGLPSFISEFRLEHTYWRTEAYDFMEKWQRAKGFDYSTTEYAKSLGYPILEVIPRDFQSRFEDLKDSPDVLEMDIDSGTDDQMDFTPTAGTEDDSSSLNMEIDVDT